MGLLVVLRRTGHAVPVILADLREEVADRTALPAARHWPDREEVLAPQDRLTDGTWCGVNRHGLLAALVNRDGSTGPLPGKRSRGELPLEALDHADADAAVKALLDLDARVYRPFNMVLADNRDAFWLRNDGRKGKAYSLPDGLTLIAGREANDPGDPRLMAALTRLKEASAPDTDGGVAWRDILKEYAAATPAPLTARSLTLIRLPAIGTEAEPTLDHHDQV